MRLKQNLLLNIFIGLMLFNIACMAYPMRVTVKNYHKVSKSLYRSAQPNKKGMVQLEQNGIKSILNLRMRLDDQREIKGTKLKEYHVPMQAKKINLNDMSRALRAYHNAPKPVLVHCRRGSDRTGCFVACYLMVYEGATKEEAIKVLLDEKLGYYEGLFPNILEFIENTEIETLKSLINQTPLE